ncbi:MAG: DEAD/DEAH box helicase family protein [bacterium]|nr:DEAD/DEAH box helicase family protein [bacterium]
MNLTPQEKISLFKSLFRGREEVFAVYWEKADKSASGYTPACLNEWKAGVCYKLQRQKCKDCPHANYTGLNDYYIEEHLRGNKIYGIYPLLEDNHSYFIAADFDGKNWEKDILRFYKKCKEYNLPAYIERSKSGNGGHAWIFFEDKYPAFRSRNIMVNILREAKIIDQFAKEDSFDRLFPNQDEHSGKGFGNLIALPVQGKARENNNTIFLNPENGLLPIDDQWELLKNIKKISIAHLDKLYNKFNGAGNSDNKKGSNFSKQLTITVAEKIYINKINLPRALVNFLRDELNFINSEFLIKKRMGLSTYKIERYFKLIESEENNYAIPRGFLSELVNFLNEKNIKFVLNDKRKKCEAVKLESTCKLYDYQQEAVKDMLAEDNGVLVAPPGAGKTIMGIEIISQLKQPTLILVHKKQIYSQWLQRIESFMNIPKREIGQICGNKKTVGDKITVAMLQTLSNTDNFAELGLNNIGLVLVDECHHIPAKTFRKVVTKLNPYYLYGFTATPKRKNNDEKLIYIYLGKILHTISNFTNQIKDDKFKLEENIKTEVIIKNTEIDVPFKVKIDNFQILSKIIIFDSNRNKLIIDDIKKEADNGAKCLILTERKEHVEVLSYYLKGNYEIITLTGELTEKQKNEKLKQIEAGNFQIIIATGQLIGEGTDFPNLNCLFLVYPFAFEGKLVQYIGRIQRGQNLSSTIYDYRDIKISYLEKFYKKREKYYKKHF